MNQPSGKVLDSIRAIDLSRVLAGPYCGQLLADFGADVIKIESPEGDENRKWPPLAPDGESANFGSVNRGKRGMVLNLKTQAARDLLRQLAAGADVLIHSFLPDTAERLGIGIAALRTLNPRLIVATISGYGAMGPLAEKRGYDMMVQAFSGAMSITGEPGGPPIRCGASYVDMATGLSLYGGIVTALLNRARTGQGTWVRGSLLETAVSLMGYHAVGWMQTGLMPTPMGSGVIHLVPYQSFRCSDGPMLAGAPNDPAFARFCEAIALPALAADPRFRTNTDRMHNRDALIPLLEDRFATNTVAHWTERLDARGVACAPIHTVDQTMAHPQVLANGMRVRVANPDGTTQEVLGTPFKLADGGGIAPNAAPILGHDTDAILAGVLDLTPAQIAALREQGAFTM